MLLLLPLAGCPAPQKADTGSASTGRTAAGDVARQADDPAAETPVTVWADPLLEKPLAAVAESFREVYAPGLLPVFMERGELLELATAEAQTGLPDIIITGDNEVYLALLGAGLLDEVTGRVFAGDSLALVQQKGAEYHTASLFDAYRLRFDGFALGSNSTTAGYFSRQALVSDGVLPRIEDRLVIADSGNELVSRIAAGNPPIGILPTSVFVQSRGLEIVMPIGEELHEDIRYRATAAAGRSGGDGVMALLHHLAENSAVQELLVGYGLAGRIQALDETV